MSASHIRSEANRISWIQPTAQSLHTVLVLALELLHFLQRRLFGVVLAVLLIGIKRRAELALSLADKDELGIGIFEVLGLQSAPSATGELFHNPGYRG